MGLLSFLNPIAFGQKHQTAWNALMASYTFLQLSGVRQHLVLARVCDILQDQFNIHRTMEEILETNGPIVALNFLVYGLGEEGISPALGSENWFWIKNPFVECIGAEEMLATQKQQLEKKFGVKFNIDFQ